jgi:hypothetical protein
MISRKFAGKGEKVGVGKMWNEVYLQWHPKQDLKDHQKRHLGMFRWQGLVCHLLGNCMYALYLVLGSRASFHNMPRCLFWWSFRSCFGCYCRYIFKYIKPCVMVLILDVLLVTLTSITYTALYIWKYTYSNIRNKIWKTTKKDIWACSGGKDLLKWEWGKCGMRLCCLARDTTHTYNCLGGDKQVLATS